MPKKHIFLGSFFTCLLLSSCKNQSFFFDVEKNDISVPIVTLGITSLVDLENVNKYDSKSLIPPSLKIGVNHPIVVNIQSKLMMLGFMDEDKPTSYYGESTEIAIKKFERQYGMEEDGVCTAEVYEKLMDSNALTYEVKRGFKGDDIKILQQQLYELNYLLYETDVNGYFGKKTEIAVTEMQKSNKLNTTGKIDLKTLNILYSENVVAYTINKKSDPSIVKNYQNRLTELGYYFGPCDGVYTEDFRMSVKMYQLNNSQLADGYIGPSTKFSLDSKYARPFSMFMGQRSQAVRLVQNRLVELNYLEEKRATGYYGEFTAQAIALFQQENGLKITGAVNGETNIKLNAEDAIPSKDGPIKFMKQFIIDTIELQKSLEENQNIGNIEDFLKVAKLKLGAKYVWGSRGPNTFDCSGFVFWCLNQIGVNIQYMTTYNWRFSTQFERIERFEDLITGDLIILNGHMGIVDDNETVIDASSSNGKVVHRDLDEWWRERFIVGFRIFDKKLENNENLEDSE